MSQKRESSRVKDANKQKVLDEETRKLRLMKSLQALEQDNYHEDPNADVDDDEEGPMFESTFKSRRTRKSKTKPIQQKYRKTFTDKLEEEMINFKEGETNYLTAAVPPSRYPPRHFCAVCGFPSNYTCVQCGARYCSVKCYGIHKDTRCLKFTA